MGRVKNFIGNKHFRYGVKTATFTVEGSQYEYKPKSGSDVHATPLVGHLKRKHPNFCSEGVEKEKKKKPKSSSLKFVILIAITKEQAVRLLENNFQQ